MSEKLAYMPLYVRDWRSDPHVSQLPWLERAIYLDLLMLSWEAGPLPDDVQRIARGVAWEAPCETCGQNGAAFAEIVPRLLEALWERTEAGWVNPRLEEERERSAKVVAANRSRIEKMNAARKKKRRDDVRDERRDEERHEHKAQAQERDLRSLSPVLRSTDLEPDVRGGAPASEEAGPPPLEVTDEHIREALELLDRPDTLDRMRGKQYLRGYGLSEEEAREALAPSEPQQKDAH